MSPQPAPSRRRVRPKRALLCGAGTLSLILALAIIPAAASAKTTKSKHKPAAKETLHVSKEPFGDVPKGPAQIVISINQQKLHLYSDGIYVADTSIATGVPSLPTPTGVFSVIQKQRFHRSNLYSNAPMPFMQRITWSGVALHEGENIGHPASHGCIRMPGEFAERLYRFTKIGVRVIIARPELKPVEFADAHLFVHKAPPPPPAPPVAAADPVKTAQTTDSNKAIDAASAAKVDPAGGDAANANTPPPTGAPNNEAAGNAEPPPAATPNGEVPRSGSAKNEDAAKPAPAALQRDGSAKPTDVASAEPLRGTAIDPADPVVPVPLAKPAALVEAAAAGHGPIAIFISRKAQKIYVRQDFTPLFDTPVVIAQPEQPFGTHVFTALEYRDDNVTFRWNVVSLPGEPLKAARVVEIERNPLRHAKDKHHEATLEKPIADPAPPQTPAQVLARIEIPQDMIDRISALMVPGSSLIVSDQGLGDETGEGTDFIVVTR